MTSVGAGVPPVAVVDYGASNLHSVCRALQAVGADPVRVSDAEALAGAERIVLPGVGAFGSGMAALRERGLDAALRELAAAGRPIFGICLGMQLLFERGLEHGDHQGLGLLPGTVEPLRAAGVRVPHMGWHELELVRESRLFPRPFAAYFAHSFAVQGDHADAVAVVTHGVRVVAAVERGALVGCQFHPEKSGPEGLELLRRFVETS